MLWLRGKGMRFVPIYGRQAFKVDGRFKFWGGLTVEAWGGGPGPRRGAQEGGATQRHPDFLRGARDVAAAWRRRRARAQRALSGQVANDPHCKAVVLAAGGFESNPEWRTRYLGPGWDLAKVRGTRFNTGDGIRMALDAGAAPCGNWSGCHAVGWDRNAPEFGDLAVGDGFQKHSYPFGIMLNASGERFVDEGADFRNYTYAKYGAVILRQPGQFAWQIFDRKVTHLLRDEYRIRQVTKVTANTLEALVGKLDDVNPAKALETIRAYNAAVRTDIAFNPNVKDGRRTRRPGRAQIQLGQSARYTAVRGLCGFLRHYVHLRRIAHHHRCAGHRHGRHAPCRAFMRRANWSAACSTSTIPAAPD